MEKLRVACRCGRVVQVLAEHAGKSCRCHDCGSRITIPKKPSIVPIDSEEDDLSAAIAAAKSAGAMSVTAKISCPCCEKDFTRKLSKAKQQVLCPECDATLQAEVDFETNTLTTVRFIKHVSLQTPKHPSGRNAGGGQSLRTGLRILFWSWSASLIVQAALGVPGLGISLGMGFATAVGGGGVNVAEMAGPACGLGCVVVSTVVLAITYVLAEEFLVTVVVFLIATHTAFGLVFVAPAVLGTLLLVSAVVLTLAAAALPIGFIYLALGVRSTPEAACLAAAGLAFGGGTGLLTSVLAGISDFHLPDLGSLTTGGLGLMVCFALLLLAAVHPLLVLFLAAIAQRFDSPATAAGLLVSYGWVILVSTMISWGVIIVWAAAGGSAVVGMLAGGLLPCLQAINHIWSLWSAQTVHDLIRE